MIEKRKSFLEIINMILILDTKLKILKPNHDLKNESFDRP